MNPEQYACRRAYLHELLALHRREFEKIVIKPTIDELVLLEAMRTPARLVTIELAQELPFPPPQGVTR